MTLLLLLAVVRGLVWVCMMQLGEVAVAGM
jgi:hypothetical protein